MIRKLLALLIGFVALLSPTVLLALQETQEEGQPPQEEETLPAFSETVVVTASRTETQVIDAPASVTVIDSRTIENAGAQSYGDLMRTVPGANVSQTSARDINVTSRSATSTLSTSQLALLDGRTIYQDFFGFVAWDLLPIDTSEIAQIEVINGPASAVWGPNAMTGVVNIISKTPRQLAGTSVTLGYGVIDRSAGEDLDTGTSFHLNLRHAQALNERWAYKLSVGVSGMDPFARPVGQVPVTNDPRRGPAGGGDYPAFPNQGTSQPKIDARVDYDHPDGRQRFIFSGGVAGTDGIIHSGIGPFDIQPGTVLGYGKISYQRDNLSVSFFANILDGEAPALLALGVDGEPIDFKFANETYDVEFSNSQTVGAKHLLNYGGNFRANTFELSIAPGGDSRVDGGLYIQDEIFLSEHFRWILGGRADGFSVLDKVVFSPRTTFMFKPTRAHTFRVSYNRAFRAPSFVNSFLDTDIVQPVEIPGIAPVPVQLVFPIQALGNTALSEARLTAYEVGYTGTLAERHTVSAAIYWNQSSRGISFRTTGIYTSANPPPGWPLPPQVLDVLAARGIPLPAVLSYVNTEGGHGKGVELGLRTRVSSEIDLFANYSWQSEPDPNDPEDFGEINIPPANRVNLGVNFDNGTLFGGAALNFTGEAFWTDVLDARFHGPTEAYTMLDGSFGVRFADGRLSAAVKFVDLNNGDAQQHVFGDIVKRQVRVEMKLDF